MESNAARILVGLGSVAAIVALLFVFSGGDDDDDGGSGTVAETTTTAPSGGDKSGKNKTEGKGKSQAGKNPGPRFERIVIEGGQPKGGVQDLQYKAGDVIRMRFVSDVAEEVHVHGYDITKDVEAGGSVKFEFDAGIDGVFEAELEQSGVQLVQFTVNP